MSVVFEAEDCTVKIWEMSGDSKGSVVTSDWAFAEGIRFTEVPQKKKSPNCGVDRPRYTVMGWNRSLSINRIQTGKAEDMALAFDTTKLYWIELYFEVNTGAYQFETHTLKYCFPVKRELRTGQLNNTLKQWEVGAYS
jgi:hypothetical protein